MISDLWQMVISMQQTARYCDICLCVGMVTLWGAPGTKVLMLTYI